MRTAPDRVNRRTTGAPAASSTADKKRRTDSSTAPVDAIQSRQRTAKDTNIRPSGGKDTGTEELRRLAPDVRAELRGLPPVTVAKVAHHLVAAGTLLDEDPEAAYQHAREARRLAPRIPAVREALGICAYKTGRYGEALAEFRTHRRLTGVVDYLPVMADCERGLGRPERAIEIAQDPAAAALSPGMAVELRIVLAGARLDLGQPDAALLALRGADLDPNRRDPWSARLFYAYAQALAQAGRATEAREWFAAAAAADTEGETDAAERIGSSSAATVIADSPAADDVVVYDTLEDAAASHGAAARVSRRSSRSRPGRQGEMPPGENRQPRNDRTATQQRNRTRTPAGDRPSR